MIITTIQLKQLLSAGAGLVLDASTLTYIQLKQVAATAAMANSKITLKNIQNITAAHLKVIVATAPGLIEVDFT